MQKYYSLETNNNESDLYIFGDITSYAWDEKDRDAYGIVKELQSLDSQKINVHINSYGGDVAEGLAIFNTLKNHKAEIVTICDGFACSAASVIFMAGSKRVINEASLLMIHNPWTYACGNANEFRKQAEDLDKIAQASINAYVGRTSITEEKVKELLDNETWLTAQECLEMGFATEIKEVEEEKGVNQSAFMAIREKVLARPKIEYLTKEVPAIDVDALVETIVEKLKEKETVNIKESSWDSYFYGGK